jgi:acetolactate synthase-1/2/3 large subunit
MEAFCADSPLLIVFVGGTEKDIRQGALHAIGQIESIFNNITKAVFYIQNEKDFTHDLEAAYRLTISPRPGPVLVSIPYKILDKECFFNDGRVKDHDEVGKGHLTCDQNLLEKVLRDSTKPVVLVGKSLMESGAGTQLGEVCKKAGVPILTSTSGKGAISDDHHCAMGHMASLGQVRKILDMSDMVLAIGTRLRKSDTINRGIKLKRLVHIDVDERWLDQNYRAHLAMVADMTASVDSLAHIWKDKRFLWDLSSLKIMQEEQKAELTQSKDGMRLVKLLGESVPKNTTTVWDPTMFGYWAEEWFSVFRPRSFIYPHGTSSIFFGLPAAIGAKLGRPQDACLCVMGDGGFLSVSAELITLKTHNIPIVVLIYNNSSYGVLEYYMEQRFGKRNKMTLANPDFIKLSLSFGIKAARAENIEQLESIFQHYVTWDEPFVIDFDFHLFAPPWQL